MYTSQVARILEPLLISVGKSVRRLMIPRIPSLCIQSVVSFPDGYSVLGWQLRWYSVEMSSWGMSRLAIGGTKQMSTLLVEINPSDVVLSWMDPTYSEWQKGRDHIKTVIILSLLLIWLSRCSLDACKSVGQDSMCLLFLKLYFMSGTILFSVSPPSWSVVIKFSINYTLLLIVPDTVR